MDRHIIQTINDHVAPDDELYLLGDLSLNNNKAIWFLQQLVCKNVYIVVGNHDAWHPRHKGRMKTTEMTLQQCPNVKEIVVRKIINMGGRPVLLCHFPWAEEEDERHGLKYMEFRPRRKDFPGVRYLLCGHRHYPSDKKVGDRCLDIGWDAWARPVKESEILEIINAGT